MSFITCIIGGSVRAMFCRKSAVFDRAVAAPPFSQTTTLSNLMFEIALARRLGQVVEVLEHQQLERLLRPPQASMIFLQALALLGQDLVLAAGLGFELGVDRRRLGLGFDAALLGLGLGVDDDPGLLGLGRRFERGPLLGFDLLGLGQRRLGHRPVLRFQHRRLGLALLRLAELIGLGLLAPAASACDAAIFAWAVGLAVDGLGVGLGQADALVAVGLGDLRPRARTPPSARRPSGRGRARRCGSPAAAAIP